MLEFPCPACIPVLVLLLALQIGACASRIPGNADFAGRSVGVPAIPCRHSAARRAAVDQRRDQRPAAVRFVRFGLGRRCGIAVRHFRHRQSIPFTAGFRRAGLSDRRAGGGRLSIARCLRASRCAGLSTIPRAWPSATATTISGRYRAAGVVRNRDRAWFVTAPPANGGARPLARHSARPAQLPDSNQALEAVTLDPRWGVLTGTEAPLRNDPAGQIRIFAADGRFWRYPLGAAPGSALVAMETLPDGSLLTLERAYVSPLRPFAISLRRTELPASEKKAPLQVSDVAVFDSDRGWLLDNFEGLDPLSGPAVLHDQRRQLQSWQATLLVYFELLPLSVRNPGNGDSDDRRFDPGPGDRIRPPVFRISRYPARNAPLPSPGTVPGPTVSPNRQRKTKLVDKDSGKLQYHGLIRYFIQSWPLLATVC